MFMAVAAVMFSSCGDDEITYPVTLNYETTDYSDLKAYENSGGTANEIDAAAYESDADLVFGAEDALTSIVLLSETTGQLVEGTDIADVTYTKDGSTYTFVQTVGTETSTVIVTGDEDELKVDGRVSKAISADGSFSFTFPAACLTINTGETTCPEPADLFDTDDEEGTIAVIREVTLVFKAAE